MSNTSAETPVWVAELIKRTARDTTGVWVVTDTTDNTQLFMKLNTPRAEHHAKLIARAPSLERENAELKKENARLKAANAVMKRLGTSEEVAETIKRYKALVSAQEGYIQFLSSHIDSQTQFMAIHNQFTSVEAIERGIQFRESIAAAKSALSGTNE